MHILRSLKPAMLAIAAALSFVALLTANAFADGDHGASGHMGAMHGMAHGGHSMHQGQAAHQSRATHGRHSAAPDEHAAHGDEHAADHGAKAVAKDRPVGLVLAGFLGFNAMVLIAALMLRRRPDAVKRRKTLARMRRADTAQGEASA